MILLKKRLIISGLHAIETNNQRIHSVPTNIKRYQQHDMRIDIKYT